MKTSTHYPLLWKFILIIFGLFIPMMIVWLLIGEINLAHTNWLVAEFGKKWGLITGDEYGFGINNHTAMISWEPFLITFCILIFNSLLFYFLYKVNLININFYPLLIASWAILFAIITSGLLYPNPQNSNAEIWKILVRLIIVILSFPIVFFISNWMLMKFLMHHSIGMKVANEILQQEICTTEYIKDNIHNSKWKGKKIPKKNSIDIIE